MTAGFAGGGVVARGANGLTLRGATGVATRPVAVLEPLGFAVAGFTGCVASSGICCTSRLRLGDSGAVAVVGLVAAGVGGAITGGVLVTTASGAGV
jgi:hypothetical protein